MVSPREPFSHAFCQCNPTEMYSRSRCAPSYGPTVMSSKRDMRPCGLPSTVGFRCRLALGINFCTIVLGPEPMICKQRSCVHAPRANPSRHAHRDWPTPTGRRLEAVTSRSDMSVHRGPGLDQPSLLLRILSTPLLGSRRFHQIPLGRGTVARNAGRQGGDVANNQKIKVEMARMGRVAFQSRHISGEEMEQQRGSTDQREMDR